MIDVYTWTTGNGRKIPIFLEETGMPYRLHMVNIHNGEQFKPEFVAICPNSKIPAIIDQDGPGGKPLTLFEFGRDPDLSRRQDRQVHRRRMRPAATTPSNG